MSDQEGIRIIQEILARHGETRILSMKGVSRESILSAALGLATRLDEIPELRGWTDPDHIAFIETLDEWFSEPATGPPQQTDRIKIDVSRPASLIVRGLIESAAGDADAVALHLVGASLHVRLAPVGLRVENHGYTASDEVSGRPGDFLINDTVFHVTLSPLHRVVQKCASNLRAGYKPYLLVPDRYVDMTRGLAAIEGILDELAISSIEQFVEQTVDGMGAFSRDGLKTMFRRLLETYNARVQAVETDPSLLIEISESLG